VAALSRAELTCVQPYKQAQHRFTDTTSTEFGLKSPQVTRAPLLYNCARTDTYAAAAQCGIVWIASYSVVTRAPVRWAVPLCSVSCAPLSLCHGALQQQWLQHACMLACSCAAAAPCVLCPILRSRYRSEAAALLAVTLGKLLAGQPASTCVHIAPHTCTVPAPYICV
jgi:hypothetical protein